MMMTLEWVGALATGGMLSDKEIDRGIRTPEAPAKTFAAKVPLFLLLPLLLPPLLFLLLERMLALLPLCGFWLCQLSVAQ